MLQVRELKKNSKLLKTMITDVESEVVVQKETILKDTMLQVRELSKSMAVKNIQKTQEVTIQQMMEEIKKHKVNIEKTFKKSISIMEQGIEKSKEERLQQNEKLAKKMSQLTEKMEKSDEATGEAKLLIERMDKSMQDVTVSVQEGQAQLEEHENEVAALKKQLTNAVDQMEKMESEMVSPEQLESLETLIQKVASESSTVEIKIEKATKSREADVEALKKRVTDNEEAIDMAESDVASASDDIDGMMQIAKEINSQQNGIVDEAVKNVLDEVAIMVQQTTKEVAKKQMQKAEEDAEIMVGVMQESSKKLETKLEKETKAREKQDKEIIGLQSKISELMVQLESKTTDNTVEEVETMVSVMQEKIRKEKGERSKSEKEIQLMREEMSMMQLEMNKEKEIIETWITNEEVIDKHFAEVNAVEVREEAEESAAANEKMLQETKAKMQSIVSKFDKKMEADQKKRLEHETAVNLLQGQTRELFERSAANSQRISALEEKCSAKVDELKKAINGLATRLQVSQTSSGGDLT